MAQALHWFDFEKFYKEVRRVATSEALIAAWIYPLVKVNSEVDELVLHYYLDIVGPYWPEERKYIDERYSTIPFPFKPITPPDFVIEKQWNLEQLVHYLGTWSSVKNYINQHQSNPLDTIRKPLEVAWGDPRSKKKVHWPIYMKVGWVN